MKKLMFIVVACALMAACNQNSKTDKTAEQTDTIAADSMAATLDSTKYVGLLPAADCPGIRYELTLANDNSNGYKLKMVYLEAEKGKDKTFSYSGEKEKIEKNINGKETKAYKLNLGKEESPLYFLVVDDSTLRMVNADLKEAESGLNYDLKKK